MNSLHLDRTLQKKAESLGYMNKYDCARGLVQDNGMTYKQAASIIGCEKTVIGLWIKRTDIDSGCRSNRILDCNKCNMILDCRTAIRKGNKLVRKECEI